MNNQRRINEAKPLNMDEAERDKAEMGNRAEPNDHLSGPVAYLWRESVSREGVLHRVHSKG